MCVNASHKVRVIFRTGCIEVADVQSAQTSGSRTVGSWGTRMTHGLFFPMDVCAGVARRAVATRRPCLS